MSVSCASMFSCAGVGDYGFHRAGLTCLATQEREQSRMHFQRLNNLCSVESGYITGDITDESVYDRFIEHAAGAGVVLATPPCQGMSVANRKRGDETERNSLVTASIRAVDELEPLAFIVENVPAFITTDCTGLDGTNRPIGREIDRVLSGRYTISSATVNLNRHGSPSSRTRSLTFGTRKDTGVDPGALAPPPTSTPTLRELIGHLPSLTEFGETAPGDMLHGFRRYSPRMRDWISGMPEGACAFDNADPLRRPHQVIDGEVVPNKRSASDKYTRMVWDKPAPCVHTRNDTLSSQNTIHPADDRVLSIREVMILMGLDDGYHWIDPELTGDAAATALRRYEKTIRTCLGEAVPVPVMYAIGTAIAREFG